MLDSVKYRSEEIPILTIPEGTLLFRISHDLTRDKLGDKQDDGTYCIDNQLQLYFYSAPFANTLMLSHWFGSKHPIHTFVTTRDIKVVLMLSPSKLTRNDRTRKGYFMKPCSALKKKTCKRQLNEYDICFSNTFLEKYPDVVGYIGISPKDSNRLKVALRTKAIKKQKLNKYIKFAELDDGFKGIPELAIHPLQKREPKLTISQPTDTLDLNFRYLKTFHSTNIAQMKVFMDAHAIYNPDTYYFQYKQ